MPSIGDTIARLQELARRAAASSPTQFDRLRPLGAFGSNPGELTGWFHAPDVPGPMPLVVVLHGCGQTAASYDAGAGWSALAERHGFAVLFPEQRRGNNANGCFNWFSPDDTRRGSGEALSIRQMVAEMATRMRIDPARIYVTGLSAGGAMTAAMLATNPDVFAGGAIIAGLPYGTATTMPQAFERMRGQGIAGDEALARLVRSASPTRGRWPTVSVWHGDADATVSARNADAILGQWRTLHGVAAEPDRRDVIDGVPRRRWLDENGRVAIEDYRVAGMAHGTPLQTSGPRGCGTAGAYMLEAGISSTWHIASGWGLLDEEPAPAAGALRAVDTADRGAARDNVLHRVGSTPEPSAPTGVQATIEAALRSAGLMR